MILKKALRFEQAQLFLIGGASYLCIELLWRGYTHWTMGVTGGLCFIGICWIHRKLIRYPLYLQAIVTTLFITMVEFITGIIVNLQFGWSVWDYSEEPLNLLGQICIPYMLLWLPLSIIAIVAYRLLRFWLYGETMQTVRWY